MWFLCGRPRLLFLSIIANQYNAKTPIAHQMMNVALSLAQLKFTRFRYKDEAKTLSSNMSVSWLPDKQI